MGILPTLIDDRQIPESAPSKFKMTNSVLIIIKIARFILCTKET
jgi:hypothetical protein